MQLQDWVAPLAGVLLLFVGVTLMRRHYVMWRQRKNETHLADSDRGHFYRRYRRRMLTSGMLALLGLLIPIGDNLDRLLPIPQRVLAAVWTAYWIGVLLLTGWVMLLAFSDLVSTGAYTRAELARVRQEQRKLERQLEEIKRRGSNGRRPEG